MKRFIHSSFHRSKFNAAFSEVSKVRSEIPAQRQYLQFSKSRLVDFGELPLGQIPEALKFSRPTTLTKLPNGIRVATQYWVGNEAAITVTIKAGSRQQNLSNSSVAQFVAYCGLQGTATYTKEQIQDKIDSLGSLKIKVSRELSQFVLTFDKDRLQQAIDFLQQIVLKPSFNSIQIQSLKPLLYKNSSTMDPFDLTVQSVHYTSFRDHYIGQPSTGIRDLVYSITKDQVNQFHSKFYVGQNIVISGAGDIHTAQFNNLISQNFGVASKQSDNVDSNSEKPLFTPSLMFQRDDQITNSSFGVVFLAPSWNDPDFFAMQYFKRLIGQYQCDKYTGAHLNNADLQYNSFHSILGSYPDIIMQKPIYFPYSDVGLFGNFIYGNQVFNRQMILMTQNALSCYAQYINQTEIFRARNKFWNQLLEYNDISNVSRRNSIQIAYLDRIISRTQIAKRITHMDGEYLHKVATKWFWDKEIGVSAWGPLHNIISSAHYNRPYRRSTLGEYSMLDVHYNTF